MGALDQVVDLKNKGVSDQEIIQKLTEQGLAPADITDALSRAQIKSAVSNLDEQGDSTEGMEHSILGNEDEPDRLPTEGDITDADLTPPSPGMGYGRPMMGMPAKITKEIPGEDMYEPQNAFYPQQQYQQYPEMQDQSQQQGYGYAPMAAPDTDTMMEVAEQVFSEKNKPIQKKIDEMNEFKVLTQSKVDYISERLKKIESIIDSLQSSILDKVEGYGDGLESIKKEMGMMQDSFGKVVNNLADRAEEKRPVFRQQQPAPVQQPIQREEDNKGNILVQKSKKTIKKISRR
ncbi:MAG: hypothetical protein ABSG05_02285 [Candidatus Pacearchaeota archaeon]|jgi:hypothetical protein